MNKTTEFYLKQLAPLVGATISGLAVTDPKNGSCGMEFFGIEATMPSGEKKAILFLSDDEGNGPGSFEILGR
jgi:hypothetical protein